MISSAFALGGCFEPIDFECTSDEQCGAAGICEPDVNRCSARDDSCPGGRRYSRHAGNWSGACVEEMPSATTGEDSEQSTSSTTGGSNDLPPPPRPTGTTDPSSTTTGAPDPSGGGSADGSSGVVDGSSTGADEGSSGSTGGMTPCEQAFGAAPGFDLCMAAETTCQFYAITDHQSCNDLCSLFGSRCLHGFNELQGTTCVVDEFAPDDCAANLADQICECEL